MDIKIALGEIRKMATMTYSEYIRTLPAPKAIVNLSEPPSDKLDEAHAWQEQAKLVLSEKNYALACTVVKTSVDADRSMLGQFCKAGKITPAVANRLSALSEKRRANQLVKLAEGNQPGAEDDDDTMNDVVGALGDLPDNLAKSDGDQTAGAAPGSDPTAGQLAGGDTAGDSPQDQLMSLATQISKEKGIPFEKALVEAEKMLEQKGGMN